MHTKSESKIKIITKHKNKRGPVPAELMEVLKEVFYQHGGVTALADATGLARTAIGSVKNSGLATKRTIKALEKGIAKLQKAAA